MDRTNTEVKMAVRCTTERLNEQGLTAYFEQMADADGRVQTTVQWLVEISLLIQDDVERRAMPMPYPPTWTDYLGHWWRQWTGGCRLTDVEPLTSIDKFEPACRVCKHRQYEFWKLCSHGKEIEEMV